MRVLMMLSSIAMGGAERNVVSILPHLQEVGIDVKLCTLNTRRDSALAEVFSVSGIERFDLGATRLTDRKSWMRFSSLLRSEKIDIVHAQDQDAIIYTGLANRFLGVKTLMTRHVLQEIASSWKSTLRARLVLWLARHNMNRVVAVSEAVRQLFAKQSGVALSKIETIYNGIEIEKFETHKTRVEIRRRLGWDLDKKIAVHLSVFRPEKGYDLLFAALPLIKASLPEFQIKLIGDDSLESALRQESIGLKDTVQFMGQRMDVPDLLTASDLLLQTSWSEALPTVLIEAGASSRPVVATNVGGTSEIVLDGSGGFVVEPGNANALAERVVEILGDSALVDRMGINAKERIVNTFTLNQQAIKTKALYEKVLDAATL